MQDNDLILLLGVQGHHTSPYGQGSYDGDYCKVCAWQGGRNSGKSHTEATRAEAFAARLAEHDRAVRAAAVQPLLDACDAADDWVEGYGGAEATLLTSKVRDIVAKAVS